MTGFALQAELALLEERQQTIREEQRRYEALIAAVRARDRLSESVS